MSNANANAPVREGNSAAAAPPPTLAEAAAEVRDRMWVARTGMPLMELYGPIERRMFTLIKDHDGFRERLLAVLVAVKAAYPDKAPTDRKFEEALDTAHHAIYGRGLPRPKEEARPPCDGPDWWN